MSAPQPVPTVPSHDEIAALMGAVLAGELTAAQLALLARLLDEVGTSVRVSARLADRRRDPVWNPVVAAYTALIAQVQL